MSRSPITIEGNVTGDVRVHTFNDGSRVANFTVAVNSRKKDQRSGEWEEVGAQFFDCTAPNHLVDAVCNNLAKGTPVVVSGTLDFRDWTGKQGNTGTALEIYVNSIGYSIRFHDVQGGRRQQGGGGGRPGSAASYYGQPQTAQQGYQPQGAPQQQGGYPSQPQAQSEWGRPAVPPQQTSQDNPWGQHPGAQQQYEQQSFGSGFDDEQPF